jgi:neutral ceramidase
VSYSAGSAKINITPPSTIPYVGGLPRHSFFERVHDHLYAKAVAITDISPNKTMIIISVDALGLNNDILGPGRNFTREVRSAITKAIGVPAEAVMVASSHAHSTSETGDVRHLYDLPGGVKWVESLRDKLAEAAVKAYRSRQRVTATYVTGEIEAGYFGINRDAWAYPPGKAPLDPEIGVLTLRNAARTKRIVLVSFTCHPVIVQVNPMVSADYPGVATAFVERNVPGADVCMFLQGACGNIDPAPDPMWRHPNFKPDNTPDEPAIRDSFAHAERIGLALGMTAADMCVGPPGEPVSGPVKVIRQRITAPARSDFPDRDPIQAEFDVRKKAVRAAIDRGAPVEEIVSLRIAAAELEELLATIDRGSAPIPTEVQGLRFGNVAFIGMPGEPFCEYGLALRARSSDVRSIVPVGYANDYLGYFMPPEIWDAGVWEATLGCQTRMAREAGALISDTSQQVVDQLWERPV